MRAFKVKTNVEVINRQKVEGVKSQKANDILAWRNPIQVASYTASPSESERSKQEFHPHNTTEALLASDVPELVVFIQESDYRSIKNIFIDREEPSSSGLNYMNDDREEPKKTLGIMSSISNEIEQDFQNYARRQHALGSLMKKSEEDSDGRDDHLLVKPVEKMMPEKQLLKEVHTEDDASLNPLESSASESIEDSSHLSEASSNSEAESGSTIHLSDSSLTTMSSLEEFLEGPEYQQPCKTDNLFRTEDTMSRSVTCPSQSLTNQLAHADDDSFAVSPLSVLMPCSGSISLHSTSSNASSKSFAFPILPSEWNGSPVRMAKADQRKPRKQQSWRTCFVCCKS